MSEEIQDSDNLGSVSDHNPLSSLIDDLYFLKCSLVKNAKLSSESFLNFQQIVNLLEAHPDLCKSLFQWKFLENELLYFLRGSKFKESLKIATLLISTMQAAPELYFTKKFLFFLTEKLYISLGGNDKKVNENTQISNDLNMFNDSFVDISNYPMPHNDGVSDNLKSIGSSQIRSSQKGSFGTSNMPFSEYLPNTFEKPSKINHEVSKLIMKFTGELIKINKSAASILYDLSFFELSNECIYSETAEMFNTVFIDISFPYAQQPNANGDAWIQDGLYEVQRKHFDPEVIFRSRDMFSPKTIFENLSAGVYNKIYQQCTNIRDFADIAFTSCIDLMLYKKISYTCQDLESLIIEGKNEKAIRFYRRSLESGHIPEESVLSALVKSLDNPKISREAVICLYYFIEYISSSKAFTENKIRSIFESLEFHCEHECLQKKLQLKLDPFKNKKSHLAPVVHEETFDHSFDSNLASTRIFGNSCEDGLYQNPSDLISQKKPVKSVLEDFSEFENELDQSSAAQINLVAKEYLCERKRIVVFLKHLYLITHNKESFFKPSYLILMSFTLAHLPDENEFITSFYQDFLSFCKKDYRNIAKAFIPLGIKEIKHKKRKIKMEESEMDFYGIKGSHDGLDQNYEGSHDGTDQNYEESYDGIEGFLHDQAMESKDLNKSNIEAEKAKSHGLKVVKNVIESSED